MKTRITTVLCVLALVLGGCGSEPASTPDVSAAPQAATAPAPRGMPAIAGTYDVSGVTVAEGSGEARDISGTMIIAREGDRYTATFNLNTIFPFPGGGEVKSVVHEVCSEIWGSASLAACWAERIM